MKEVYEDLRAACELTGRELGEMVDKVQDAGGKMTNADLEAIDKLTHAMKSIKTTMAMMDAEGDSYAHYDRAYDDNYARAGRRRDSMGRYTRRSYDDGVMR